MSLFFCLCVVACSVCALRCEWVTMANIQSVCSGWHNVVLAASSNAHLLIES